MSDDLVKRLRFGVALDEQGDVSWCNQEAMFKAADRIEKLVEENGVLFAANVRLNSRADLDSDGYADRIKDLEAALTHIYAWYPISTFNPHQTIKEIKGFARKALEGYDD